MATLFEARDRALARRMGWIRVAIALFGLLVFPLYAPAFAAHRPLIATYLALVLAVQWMMARGIGESWRPLFFSIVDLAVLAYFVHRVGSLAPMMIAGYLLVVILYPIALGLWRGVLLGSIASCFFVSMVMLEALGVVPYAPDAPVWSRAGAPPDRTYAIVLSITFPTMLLSAVIVVGKLVESIKSERAKNQELLAKLVVGRYRLERLLGQGGMGQVWEAIDLSGGERVALKFLSPDAASSPEARQRLLREARAASEVDHPNVVRVRDVFELEEGIPVLVMDLLVGETLGARLARDGRMSVEDCASIMAPVVAAVSALHARGIVHRDLKPDNIHIGAGLDGALDVKVLDLGIAKQPLREASDATASLTGTDVVVGTPWYMAPEQAFGEGRVDHRLDVWALGVILYECLAGVRPIEGDNPGQIFRALLADPIAPIEQRVPGLPAELAAAIDRALVRDRDARLDDLGELHAALARHAR